MLWPGYKRCWGAKEGHDLLTLLKWLYAKERFPVADKEQALLRIEVGTARPPTGKCREVIAVLEEAVRQFPGQVRLVVYERGAPWSEPPTEEFLKAAKFGQVPTVVVGGKLQAVGKVPTLEAILAAIEEVRDKSTKP